MADFTADNVYSTGRRELLDAISTRLAEFCRFVWPLGRLDGDWFYPVPPSKVGVCVPANPRNPSLGVAVNGLGAPMGSVFDLMRELEIREQPGALISEFLKTLPPAPEEDSYRPLWSGVNAVLDWDGKAAPERAWIVEGWLPVGHVTSFYGGGGLGKSLIAQHLAVAVGTGRPFFGLPTTQGQVMMLACEDEESEVRRRLENINASMGGAPLDHARTGLIQWFARHGEPNVMATGGANDGMVQLTRLFHDMRDTARRLKVKLLIVDNIAQVFAGNENSRPQVTQFCNALNGIARELNCAVLLLGHPGKSSESEYSGSTAWDAAVRSRWYLGRPKDDGLEDADLPTDQSDMRVLRKAKANYSSSGDEIKLVWDRGAFHLETPEIKDAVDRIEERVRQRSTDERVLAGLHGALRDGYMPSPHQKARDSFAPLMLRQVRPELRDLSPAVVWGSLCRMRDARQVVLGRTHGPPSKQKDVLVPAGHHFAVRPDCNRSEASNTPSDNREDPFQHPADTPPKPSNTPPNPLKSNDFQHPSNTPADTFRQGS